MSESLASISGHGGARRVALAREIAHPIASVWRALVEPGLVEQWFAPWSIEPREGGRIELNFGDVVVSGSIKAFMPPHVLAYTWEQPGERISLVVFDLVAIRAGGTRLSVMQTALDESVSGEVAAGWHVMLDRLIEHLASGAFAPQNAARSRELHERYREIAGQ